MATSGSFNQPPELPQRPREIALECALAARRAVTTVLAERTSFDDLATRLLRELGETLGCTSGTLWISRDRRLMAAATWTVTTSEDAHRKPPIPAPPQSELARLAWQRRRLVNTATLRAERLDTRSDRGTGARPATVVAAPVIWRDQVLAVIELGAPVLSEITESAMNAIGYEIGASFSRRRAQLDIPPLSSRELDVLRLAAGGLSAAQLAARLSVSTTTVNTHLGHIYAKLGAANRTAAVATALRDGLID